MDGMGDPAAVQQMRRSDGAKGGISKGRARHRHRSAPLRGHGPGDPAGSQEQALPPDRESAPGERWGAASTHGLCTQPR